MLMEQGKSMGWATRGEGAEDEETDEGRCVSGRVCDVLEVRDGVCVCGRAGAQVEEGVQHHHLVHHDQHDPRLLHRFRC